MLQARSISESYHTGCLDLIIILQLAGARLSCQATAMPVPATITLRIQQPGSPERRRRQVEEITDPSAKPTSSLSPSNEAPYGFSESVWPQLEGGWRPESSDRSDRNSVFSSQSSRHPKTLNRCALLACALLLFAGLVIWSRHVEVGPAAVTRTNIASTGIEEARLPHVPFAVLYLDSGPGSHLQLRWRALRLKSLGAHASPDRLAIALDGGSSRCTGELLTKGDAVLHGRLQCGHPMSMSSDGDAATGRSTPSGPSPASGLGKVLAAAGGQATSWGTYYKRGMVAWANEKSGDLCVLHILALES